ncbi:CAP domain-containing protein [Nocardia australiensis]|uniref:CAP domain-containing protein n=1 Tax=Nocardia australiensis TaxID=2887191 RepID=UPI001D134DF9|nr:CAP domain-containing protein [Nocardia australiensis]
MSHKDLDAKYGENLFLASSDDAEPTPAADAVDFWKNEQQHYEYGTGDPAPGTENFTQMVWKATTSVGVTRACVLAPDSDDPG